MSDFHGYPTRKLTSKFIEIECLSTAGPRIVRLSYKGSPNLLAERPEASKPTPFGDYHVLGGHRFWHAPEEMPRSYIPDNAGLTLSDLPDGLLLEGKTEPGTGIRKRVEIRLDPHLPKVYLNHTLFNDGAWEVEIAPWAITMFRLGGAIIIPALTADRSANELLPNRHFALWSYSQLHDPRLQLDDDFILLHALSKMPPLKIGTFTLQGWGAYWLDGVLFRKTFPVHPGLPHPDFNCNAETYCGPDSVELESLAPLSRLAPGASVSHPETWDFFDSLDQDFIPAALADRIRAYASRLG
jgi:hypothetical protein